MDNFEKVYNKGFALFQKGKNQEAIPFFEQTIGMNPNYMFAHYVKGLCYIRLNDWQNVITTFKTVSELAPEEGDAFYNIGIAYYHLKQYNESIENIEKSIQIGLKDNPVIQAYHSLGLAYMDQALAPTKGNFLGKWDKPLMAFKKCIELNSNHVAARFQLARILLTTKCHQEAIKHFEIILSYDPKKLGSLYIQSLMGIATSYCALDNYNKSLEFLRLAIKSDRRVKQAIKLHPDFEKLRQSSFSEEFDSLVLD